MQPARILIVEDESIVALDLAERVAAMGHEVVGVAASAVQAMEFAIAEPPDIVLMDIRIKGGTDGIELAGLMRTSLGVPVVFLTAYADDATLARACVTQPFGYLLKPINEQELAAAIATAVVRSRAEAQRQVREQGNSATLMSLPQAVLAVGDDGRILVANAAAAALLGRDLETLARLAIVDVLGGELPTVGSECDRVVRTGDGRDLRVHLRADAGVQVLPTDPAVVLTMTVAPHV